MVIIRNFTSELQDRRNDASFIERIELVERGEKL
jgi:hypothetical protein